MSANLRAMLETMDDGDMLTVRTVRRLLAEPQADAGPELVSTTQAARLLGFSAKKWRVWAEEKRIQGAWKDEADQWRLPLAACRAHLLRLQQKRSQQRSGERGPYKKAS